MGEVQLDGIELRFHGPVRRFGEHRRQATHIVKFEIFHLLPVAAAGDLQEMDELRRHLGAGLGVHAPVEVAQPGDVAVVVQTQELAALLLLDGDGFHHAEAASPQSVQHIPLDELRSDLALGCRQASDHRRQHDVVLDGQLTAEVERLEELHDQRRPLVGQRGQKIVKVLLPAARHDTDGRGVAARGAQSFLQLRRGVTAGVMENQVSVFLPSRAERSGESTNVSPNVTRLQAPRPTLHLEQHRVARLVLQGQAAHFFGPTDHVVAPDARAARLDLHYFFPAVLPLQKHVALRRGIGAGRGGERLAQDLAPQVRGQIVEGNASPRRLPGR